MRNLVAWVDVARPVRHVYDQWTQLEDLPSAMRSVAAIRQLDERTTHWVVLVDGERREFGAVITEQVPDTRIAWRSPGSPRHAGVVTFHRLDVGRTRVTVQLDWEPEGLFDKVGDRLGLLRRAVQADLERFRAFTEGRPAPTGAWRGTIAAGDDDDAVDAWRSTTAGATVAQASLAPRAAKDDARRDGTARGRHAGGPTDIPPKGWLAVLKRTGKEVKRDNASIVAAGVAFYFFLALAPALIALVSVYGLVADPADVEQQMEDVTTALPEQAADLVLEQLESVTEAEPASLGFSLVVSVLVALWSASKGMQALITALDIAYDEEDGRTFVKLRGTALLLTLGSILAVAVGVGGMVLVGSVAEDLGGALGLVVSVARWVAVALLVIVGVAALYRYAPDRDAPKWRWVSPGALLATGLVLVGSIGFSVYVSRFGSYNETYGSLTAPVVLMLWLFLVAFAIVVGAELDAESERQTARDTTRGPSRPMGSRDAHAADTVAAGTG